MFRRKGMLPGAPWRLDLASRPHSSLLRMAERQEVSDRVPPRTFEAYDEFWVCGSCGKVYWRGSHWRNIVETVEEASRIAGSPCGPRT